MNNLDHLPKTLFPIFLFLLLPYIASAGNGVLLYTPYTEISVPPGESIAYSIDVENHGSQVKDIGISLSGLPQDWAYTLKAGGFAINRISVLPGDKKTINLEVNVPAKVDKGKYRIKVIANNYDVLPIVIDVSEKGTYKTEFFCEQINMEGNSKSNFQFAAKLKNETGEKQMYSLQARAPRGWNVIFKPNYKQATAVEIDPGKTTNITVEVTPPVFVEAGTYKIQVHAINSSSEAHLPLEVVITGTYDMELTTPTGLLSSKITAGDEKNLELMLVNTGTSELNNVVFSTAKPKNWEISIKPDTIAQIKPGASANVVAVIKAADKSVPGDYISKITASTPEAKSLASFRISVKTPMLWGWLGILIVLGTLYGVYHLIQKYGRR